MFWNQFGTQLCTQFKLQLQLNAKFKQLNDNVGTQFFIFFVLQFGG